MYNINMTLPRLLMADLLQWKKSKKRKPLVLQGARQVGKTYLLKLFGQTSFKNVAYCNFERDRELPKIFESSLDPKKIILLLSTYLDSPIEPQQTLIIFDEIQECSAALTSLKYFFEEASEYAIVGAGSLLGVALSQNSSFPVGSVDFLNLHPLSFAEFVEARGKASIIEEIRSASVTDPVPSIFVGELTRFLGEYQVTGGMPEVVRRFVESSSFEEVRATQEGIVKSYVNDFARHAPPEEVIEILAVWDVIPSMLGRENKKFTYSLIKPGARAQQYERAIQWLVHAGVVRMVKRISSPKIPLRTHEDGNAFKLYYNDVGLLSCALNISPALIISPNKLLGEFSGAIVESFVGQELAALEIVPMYYWASEGQAEVDFIFELDGEVLPLEVKAGHNVKSRSLTSFIDRFAPKIALRTSLKNVDRSGMIFNCPLYALERLKKVK